MGLKVEQHYNDSLAKTQRWFDELGEDLDWDHAGGLAAALGAGLHALRDRLTPGEAAQLGAQLPLLVRGLYYEGWRPAAEPWKERHGEGFLARVAQELHGYGEMKDPEEVVRAVFRLLARHVSAGEIEDVIDQLPADVRELW